MDLQNEQSQGLEPEYPIRFAYPILTRLIMGTVGFGCLAVAVLTFPMVLNQDLEVWVSLAPLALGLLGVLLWYPLSGHILIDSQAISFQRFGKKTRIPFREILKIEHRITSDRLVIHGLNRKIIVGKQLKDYPRFYSLLVKLYPTGDREVRSLLPIEIHTRRWLLVMFWVFALSGFTVLAFAFRDSTIEGGIAGIMMATLGVAGLLAAPRKYILDYSGLSVISPIRQRMYQAKDLIDLRVSREYDLNSWTEYSELSLKYKNGTVVLRDATVDYPIEALAELLYERYQKLLNNTEYNPEDID